MSRSPHFIFILGMCVCLALAIPPRLIAEPSEMARDSDREQAIKVLKQFLAFEEAEQYEKCYEFYSKRYKEELSHAFTTITKFDERGAPIDVKSVPVTTPELYRELRLEGEARWTDPHIESVKITKGRGMRVLVRNTVLGEGEQGVERRAFFLVKQDNVWKIDDVRFER